jgi:hypothetical protein
MRRVTLRGLFAAVVAISSLGASGAVACEPLPAAPREARFAAPGFRLAPDDCFVLTPARRRVRVDFGTERDLRLFATVDASTVDDADGRVILTDLGSPELAPTVVQRDRCSTWRLGVSSRVAYAREGGPRTLYDVALDLECRLDDGRLLEARALWYDCDGS